MNEYLDLLDSTSPAATPHPAGPTTSAAQGGNEYLALLEQGAADQRRRMQGALATSVKTNPDAYAAQKQLAKYVGVPPIVAQTLPDEIKSKAAVQRVQADTVDAPLLARSYTDADFAKLAHDDSGVLSAIEAGVRWLVSAPSRDGKASTLAGDVAASYHGMTQGAAGAFQGLTETASYPLDVLENFPRIGGNPLRRLSEGFGLIARQAAADQKAAAGESKTWMGGAISSGVQSLGQNLAMIPLALLPGGQAAALTGMAATAGGQSYQEDRAKGVGHFTALGHGLSDAVIEAATEAIPMGRLIKDVKAGGPLWKAITANAAREVPGEQVATALQDLNDWAVNNEGKTFGDYLAARPEAAAQTLIATLVGVGGNVAVSHGIQGAVDRATGAQRQAQQAELHAQALGQLAALAEASKLRERDPEQFQTFAQSLADQNVPSLYVDPRALAAAGVDMQALAQALPSVAPQLEQAIATGGDLVIPTGEFVTHAPGQVFQQALVEHARTAEDAMSPAEAKTYMAEHGDKLQAEIARVIEQKAGDDTWQAGRDEVRAEFQRQLDEVRRFTPDVNKTYATVLGDFYAVTAAKAGMSPQELAQRYPLRIASKLGEGENVMEQARPVANQAETGAFKTGQPVTFNFVHNTESATALFGKPKKGDQFGRDKEPSGRYVIEGDGAPTDKHITGSLTFNSPLVIAHDGWKQTLADHYKATGKKLSAKLIADGYDGVVTVDKYGTSEILDLTTFDASKALYQSSKLPATIDIDGQQRPTTNSKGQQIAATEEGVRAFYRWFKDSKVVDGHGRPLVVYHGGNESIEAFDPGRLGSKTGAASAKEGFFFTDNQYTARHYHEPAKFINSKQEREYTARVTEISAAPILSDDEAAEKKSLSEYLAKTTPFDGDVDFDANKNRFAELSAKSNGYTRDFNGFIDTLSRFNTETADALRAAGGFNGSFVEIASRYYRAANNTTGELLRIKILSEERLRSAVAAANVEFGIASVTTEAYLSISDPKTYKFRGGSAAGTISKVVLAAKSAGNDGAVFKNVDDGGPVSSHFVAFNPEQIKSATGNTGAFDPANPSILNQSAAEPRDLVALHNLSVDNLLAADKLGGLPVPSIGVTKVDTPFGGYGDITMIGSSDMVDPAGNPVYDADVYTARFPSLIWPKVPTKKADAIHAEFKAIAKEMDDGGALSSLFDHMVNNPDKARAVEDIVRSKFGQAAFLRSRGEMVEVPLRRPQLREGYVVEKAMQEWQAANDINAAVEQAGNYQRGIDAEPGAELVSLSKAVSEAIDQSMAPLPDGDLKSKGIADLKKAALGERGMVGSQVARRIRSDLVDAKRADEVDGFRLYTSLRERTEPLEREITAWATAKLDKVFGEPQIQAGRRKVPVTLDNIVDAMTQGGVVGKEKTMTYGGGQARAGMAKRYRSLHELQADRDRVVSPEAHEAHKQTTKAKVDAYQSMVLPFYEFKNWKGEVDTWGALDDSMKALAAIGKPAKPTDTQVRAALAKNGFKGANADLIAAAKGAAQAMRDTPVDYFEAKPQRAVMLNEFKGAVVPAGLPADALAVLDKAGVKVSTYAKGDEASRREAIASLSRELDAQGGGVLFQGDKARAQIAFGRDITQQTTTLTLLKDADLSSFIHEAGHFFLEVQADLAARIEARIADGEQVSDGERQIVADMNKLLDWFGVKGDETVGGATGGALEQPAYHGTPHRGIDKFSTDKIGTGEGVQAYGWGLYFASKREIAEWYREKLAEPVLMLGGRPAADVESQLSPPARQWLKWAQYKLSAMTVEARSDEVRRLQGLLERGTPGNPGRAAFADEIGQLDYENPGQLYEVEIPEDSDMLLWDKPLSEQPEKVKTGIAELQSIGALRNVSERTPGEMIYNSAIAEGGSQRGEGASKLLSQVGIKGIKYLDGTSRAAGDGSFNYVIFSGDDVAIRQTFYQGGQDQQPTGPSPIGRTPLETWSLMSLNEKRQHHETFARGFERYAFEGKAPSLALQSLFQRFRAWLTNVYKSLKALNVELTPEVRGVMDRMLATTQQIQEAEAARNMGALFQTPEQAGMTPEQWAAYHALAVDATQEAIQTLQARGLRDMTWQRNATSRELKKLQDRAAGLRREVEREVRAEVMSQPVYRAWAFLTGKGEPDQQAQATPRVKATGELDNSRDNLFVAIAKLGGLNRAEVESQWGIRPKDERLESGVFGKPVVRRDGGLSLDAMAERLVEEGYLLPDEHGKADLRDLEEAFDSQRRGQDQFSTWHDYAERAAVANGEQPTDALPEHVTHGKLDTSTLREVYGTQPDALWRKLSTLRMTSDKVGIHPDVVAETFGFSGGDEMVRALAAADHPRQVIESLADQRMLERYGDLATPEGLQRAADQAVHTEARARAIATELTALEAAGKVRQKVPGQRNTADMLVKAAKEYAAAVIGASKVRDIKPSRYAAAEARAGAAAEKHFRAGDTAGAAAEKRNQVIQHEATRAAYAAQEEIEKAAAYLRKFDKRPKGLDAAYADQIDSLLERFDLKPASLKDIDRRASLAEWVASQQEQGLEPDIPPELLREASRKSWRDMTLDELRGLRDTVRQIEALGRLKGKLLTAQAQREFEAVRDELADSITQHAGDRKADARTPATAFGRKLAAVKAFGAAHIKAATWARILDGGKDGGPVWEYLIRGANRAGDFETTRRAQATEALTYILAPVLKQKMGGKGRFFASINRTMNREQVFSLALNTGNEGNLQRLLDGEGWTQQQIQPVLATLTAAEWRAVQGVWDHFESYRPEIGAKERRIYGKEPNWVEPTPFNITAADGAQVVMRGGYYPIKYDPLANNRAEQHSDAESAKRELQGAYTSATTRRGFTKSRTAEVSGRPILYSLAGIYSGVNDVIHDLAWHEWLIDTNKLLRSEKVDGAIRQHYGPQVVKQFKTWVKDTAAGEGGLQAELDSTLGRLRHGVSIAGLGFNVMSAAMQPLGLTQSIVRVGAGWIGKGVAQYLANPRAATRRANDSSEFMAGRARTRFRELAELRNQVEGQSKARDAISTWAYFLMMRCQQMVDVPTWLGAYEKAISEGNTEERAVALADQAVTDAQGGGQTKDLSAIERGGPAQKLFTVFYSFMNTALNVGVAQTMTAANTPKARASLAADYLLLYSVPAVLGAVLKDALTPGDSGDWDDPEKLLNKLLGEQLAFLMGLMVVVREFAEAGKTALSLSEHPRDYSGPAGVRLISDTSTMAKQAAQGEFDDQFRKAAVNLMGDLFALPAAQINRTITGAQALADGKTSNPAALVFGFQAPH